jgi:uncharacterized RmlC-like cupin family protein
MGVGEVGEGREVMLVSPVGTRVARQGVPQFFGVGGLSVGARGLSMNVTVFPPGGCSEAHLHSGYETAIYAISGRVAFFYGDRLEHEVTIEPGSFCFVPPDVPHKAFNLSDSEPAVSVTSRNDPREQENVVLTPEVDDGSADVIVARRRREGF